MIRQRKDRDGLQVQVYAGRDPLTGRKRWVSRQVPGRGRAAMGRARQVEAELLAQVAAGQHRGSKTKTVAELIERWLEWRLSVRSISPTTVAAYRGYIDRSILPSLGRLQVGQLDAATLDTFYAVVWGWISNNPARLASPPSREQADTQPPGVEDAARLLRTAAAEDPERGCSCAWPWSWAPVGRAVHAALVGGRPGPGRGADRQRRRAFAPQGPVGQADQDPRQAPRGHGRRGSGLAHRLGSRRARRWAHDPGYLCPLPAGPAPAGARASTPATTSSAGRCQAVPTASGPAPPAATTATTGRGITYALTLPGGAATTTPRSAAWSGRPPPPVRWTRRPDRLPGAGDR